MATLRKASLFWAALVLPASASAQQAGLQPASASDIASAVSGCWIAVGPTGVDAAKLEASGWKAATATDPQGKAIALPMGIYGKSGANAMLMVAGDRTSKSMCAVVAKLRSHEEINAALPVIKQALVAVDPKVKAARDGGGVVFIDLPRLAMLNATGTKEQPGMRVVVGYQNSEKK